jgi:hypothetical protein
MNQSTEPEGLSPEGRRCLSLLAAAFRERDEIRANQLIRESGEAFLDDVRARWGKSLRAAEALHDAAEKALDRAEAATDPAESAKQLKLFEMYLATSRSSAGLPPL